MNTNHSPHQLLHEYAASAQRWRWKHRPNLKLAVASCLCCAAIGLFAQNLRPSEYEVEAAYIYDFGSFIQWPATYSEQQRRSFAICVIDDDPFGSVLQSTLSGKSLAEVPVAVKRIAKAQDAIGCQVLFIAASEENNLNKILAVLGQTSVLTVSDIHDFSKRGGMIEFVMVDDRVRFAINRTAAENAGLVLQSELLKVATVVRVARPHGGR